MSEPTPFEDEALPTFSGRAWALGLRLATSHILAARDIQVEPEVARDRLFADLDPTLAARLAPDDVLVADALDGTDETAAPAMAALAAAGVGAIIARQIAPPIVAAAFASGVLVVVLDAPTIIRTGDRLRLDFAAGKVVDLSSGDRAAMRNLSDDTRAAVRAIAARRRSR